MELKAEAEGWVQKTIEQDLSVLKTQRQRQVTRALCLVNKEYKRERLRGVWSLKSVLRVGAENGGEKENLFQVLKSKLSFLGAVVGIRTQHQSWFSFEFLIFCVQKKNTFSLSLSFLSDFETLLIFKHAVRCLNSLAIMVWFYFMQTNKIVRTDEILLFLRIN